MQRYTDINFFSPNIIRYFQSHPVQHKEQLQEIIVNGASAVIISEVRSRAMMVAWRQRFKK